MASTYLGGDKNDYGRGLVVDAAGNAYISGSSWSYQLDDARTPHPGTDSKTGYGYIAKLSNNGEKKRYDFTITGGKHQVAFTAALTDAGEILVAGFTTSADFEVDCVRWRSWSMLGPVALGRWPFPSALRAARPRGI